MPDKADDGAIKHSESFTCKVKITTKTPAADKAFQQVQENSN